MDNLDVSTAGWLRSIEIELKYVFFFKNNWNRSMYDAKYLCFLPMPLAVAWVFRLTFSPSSSSSPSPSPSHLQLCSYPAEKSSCFVPTQPRKTQVFVSVRYRKRCGGPGSLAVYAILFTLLYSVEVDVGGYGKQSIRRYLHWILRRKESTVTNTWRLRIIFP